MTDLESKQIRGLAHDLNNLLTAVCGFAEIAKLDMEPSHPAADVIDQIAPTAQRCTELVRQIQIMARMQANAGAMIEMMTLRT